MVPMMHRVGDYRYGEGDGLTMLELPYKGAIWRWWCSCPGMSQASASWKRR